MKKKTFCTKVVVYLAVVTVVGLVSGLLWFMYNRLRDAEQSAINAKYELRLVKVERDDAVNELERLKQQDQYKINEDLNSKISSIEKSFKSAGDVFKQRSDMVSMGYDVQDIDKELSRMLYLLSEMKYEESGSVSGELLALMNRKIEDSKKKEVAKVSKNSVNTGTTKVGSLPENGYSRFAVDSERGRFVVAVVVEKGARVVVDTASNSDCSNNCPTMPLAEYVNRNNGFAGINGGYFCPSDYSSCQGKVNSFDTLVFNGRIKKAFNQANNVYSVVPIVVAYGSSLSFYNRTLDWGVDQGATGAVANYPMLVKDGQVVVDEGSLSSYLKDMKSTRGFIAEKDGKIVIGHVFGATVPDTAYVLKALGIRNALNLDGGGSSALWYGGGYKVGPGRSLPVSIVLVR